MKNIATNLISYFKDESNYTSKLQTFKMANRISQLCATHDRRLGDHGCDYRLATIPPKDNSTVAERLNLSRFRLHLSRI